MVKNRPVIIRQTRESNQHDVKIAALQAIAIVSKSRGMESERWDRTGDRDAIKAITLAGTGGQER